MIDDKSEKQLMSQRDFLMNGLVWQESLLQNYRGFHLNMQSFVLSAGFAVFAVQISYISQIKIGDALLIAPLKSQLGFFFLLLLLFCFHFWASRRFKVVVSNRANAVSYFQYFVLMAESQLLSEERIFLNFKKWQKGGCAKPEKYISTDGEQLRLEGEIRDLIYDGNGKTRHLIDGQIFRLISIGWWIIISLSLLLSIHLPF
ncbi:hypothetical protein [Chromobacterium alticapitis]|uniref:Uncharacterized protein n=1 Tax=Chromobacterium alticapitis TaxID=2073169 RepID=A0A2S5DH06_9NEIS|nr:hypothetical protein [Chromobacterium alticapitis]POZ62370.1 hypothetical protein C2I19_09400 [Chromobacterium alticapitis]